jgi:hypothetical protein
MSRNFEVLYKLRACLGNDAYLVYSFIEGLSIKNDADMVVIRNSVILNVLGINKLQDLEAHVKLLELWELIKCEDKKFKILDAYNKYMVLTLPKITSKWVLFKLAATTKNSFITPAEYIRRKEEFAKLPFKKAHKIIKKVEAVDNWTVSNFAMYMYNKVGNKSRPTMGYIKMVKSELFPIFVKPFDKAYLLRYIDGTYKYMIEKYGTVDEMVFFSKKIISGFLYHNSIVEVPQVRKLPTYLPKAKKWDMSEANLIEFIKSKKTAVETEHIEQQLAIEESITGEVSKYRGVMNVHDK